MSKVNHKPKPKYYRYSCPHRGVRYFKILSEYENVMQIIVHTQKKKGRPYQKGVNFMTYITFISSWGWKKEESKYIKRIKKKEFDVVLKLMIKNFTSF